MARTVMSELAEIVQPDTGRHRRPEDGVCTMELVAWISGEKHTDHPLSVSPVIAAFTRSFNDALDDAGRQRLGALAPRMIDTVGADQDELFRVQMLWDWMVALAVPEWLRAAGHDDLAAAVVRDRARALGPATVALDSFGHADVRPVDDDRTAREVSRALGIAGITGACVAGGEVADGDRGGRARRHWHAARVLARTAAWEAAEADRERSADLVGHSAVVVTAMHLRELAFGLIERLIAVTNPVASMYPPAPPAPPGYHAVSATAPSVAAATVAEPAAELSAAH